MPRQQRVDVALVAATGLVRDSKAQAEQVRSVSVERVGDRIASLDADIVRALDDAMRRHLEL